MAADLTSSTSSFVEQHPMASAGIALGVVLIVWYMVSANSGASTASSGTDTTSAAADELAAQTAANATTAQQSIAAGVTNNQTTAAQTVDLANIQAQLSASLGASNATLGSAYYSSAGEIASSNASVANTALMAQSYEQISNNQTIASEYSDLASTLTSFGNNYQSIANTNSNNQSADVQGLISGLSSQGVANLSSSGTLGTGPLASGPWNNLGAGILGSSGAPGVNNDANLIATQNTNNSAFGLLNGNFGVGITQPATQFSGTQILSMANINSAAVTNGFTNLHA